MERLLHYIWRHKLYPAVGLATTEGLPVEVIDPGLRNNDAGPDFFNAKIRIQGTMWAGNVEIHEKASDWLTHRHDQDKAYDSVILHVVGVDNLAVCRSNGESIPQLILPVSDALRHRIEPLLNAEKPLPCMGHIREIEPVHLRSWLDALLCERLERKTEDIFRLLDLYQEDWNEVFYILLTRSFGCGINSDAFEQLARSLPLKCILKQRTSLTQIEAMLFGQAGMLSEELPCHYYRFLRQEYAFFRYKFGLKPLDESLFKRLRVRPTNFPHVKLAQIAAIWHQHDTLFSVVLSAPTPRMVKECFRVPLSDYWLTHYNFHAKSVEKEKTLGDNLLNVLLINAVVPIFFAYGLRKKQQHYCERAIRLLETIPPERNHIVTAFTRAGMPICTACDTQAVIQLKRAYCEKRKCLYCRIGFRLLKRCVR